MKGRILIMAALILLSTFVFGQTARIQVIHNSPTPTVDVYANGTRLLDNFAFRTATPFIDVPAGVTINLGIGLGTSQSVRDTLVNFPVVLQAGKRYVIVANGIVGNAQKPFRLAINDLGLETASTPTNVGISFFHGSPDAPDVDILAGTSILFDNISYGRFGNYVNVPANATYQLAVTPATDNNTVVGRYEANLSFWAGQTAVVFASGLLGSTNPSDKFEPWVALSNGGTFPLKSLPVVTTPARQARLQVIHNSPTPTVDIYVNGDKLLDNFVFRTATPYISVPAGVILNIGVAPSTSTTVRDTIANFPVRLDSGKTYIAVAHGVVGNTQRPFRIAVSDAGREVSANPNNVDINFFHGSPDAPTVDILAGTNILFNDIQYARFGNYISVPANATYRLSVTPGDNNNTVVARYDANLDFWKGKSAVVIATGFLGTGGTPFQPWVVLSNGGTFPLNPVQGAIEPENFVAPIRKIAADFEASPNPAKDFVVFDFNLEKEANTAFQIINTSGQVVVEKRLSNLGKGQQQLSVDIKGLNSGLYIVRMTTGSDIKTKKLMIER